MIHFTKLLFIMSIKTSILILIILTVKFLFNRLFTGRTHYIIWFLLFISLTIPYTPESNLSIYNISKYFNQNVSISNTQLDQNAFFNNTNIINNNGDKSYFENNQSIPKENRFIATNENKTIFNFITTISKSKTLANIFAYIWLIGFLLLSFNVFIKTIKFGKLIHMEKEILDTKKILLLNKCKKTLSINKNVKLVKTNFFSTPSLVGLVYPKILLPKELLCKFNDDKLELILLHELSHLKRKDLLMNWFILIYQLIYWFNPIVWIGFYKMKNDMELACDAFVLRHLEKEKHISYGRVIIDFLEYFSKDHHIPVSTNILKNKNEVKRRIIMIKKFSKTSCQFTLISFLLISLVGCSSITSMSSFVSAPSTVSSTPKSNTLPTKTVEKTTEEVPIENSNGYISLSDSQQIVNNKSDILGKDYEYIRKIIGSPYVKTYYVNTKNLTADEILKNSSTESIYPIYNEEESSALYIFIENDKITNIKTDEFSGLPCNTWKDSDYKVNFFEYQFGSDIDDKDLTVLSELKKEFIGKSLSDFRNKFTLTHYSAEAFNKKGNLQLSIYPIVSKDSASPIGGIYILSENNIIKNIKIDRAVLQFEQLDEHFSLITQNN